MMVPAKKKTAKRGARCSRKITEQKRILRAWRKNRSQKRRMNKSPKLSRHISDTFSVVHNQSPQTSIQSQSSSSSTPIISNKSSAARTAEATDRIDRHDIFSVNTPQASTKHSHLSSTGTPIIVDKNKSSTDARRTAQLLMEQVHSNNDPSFWCGLLDMLDPTILSDFSTDVGTPISLSIRPHPNDIDTPTVYRDIQRSWANEERRSVCYDSDETFQEIKKAAFSPSGLLELEMALETIHEENRSVMHSSTTPDRKENSWKNQHRDGDDLTGMSSPVLRKSNKLSRKRWRMSPKGGRIQEMCCPKKNTKEETNDVVGVDEFASRVAGAAPR